MSTSLPFPVSPEFLRPGAYRVLLPCPPYAMYAPHDPARMDDFLWERCSLILASGLTLKPFLKEAFEDLKRKREASDRDGERVVEFVGTVRSRALEGEPQHAVAFVESDPVGVEVLRLGREFVELLAAQVLLLRRLVAAVIKLFSGFVRALFNHFQGSIGWFASPMVRESSSVSPLADGGSPATRNPRSSEVDQRSDTGSTSCPAQ